MSKFKCDRETVVETNVKKESVEKLFALDIALFNLMGLYSISSGITGKLYRRGLWEVAFFIIEVTPIIVLMVCEYIAVIRFWTEDRDYAISLFTIIFDTIICLIKLFRINAYVGNDKWRRTFILGIRMWSQRVVLHEVLRSLKISWNESLNRNTIKDEIVKLAMRTSFLCKCFAIMILACCVSYASRPYLLIVYYYVYAKHRNISFDFTQTIYPIRYTNVNDKMSTYIIYVLMEQSAMLFCGLYWACTDAMFAKLSTYATIQFRVLCYDLEHTAVKKSENEDDHELVKRLSVIAKRHHDLYAYCKIINHIYTPILFMTMLFTSANMCICVFQVDRDLSRANYNEVFSNFVHAITIMSQVMIYCSYAERLTQQSSLVAKAAYGCQWIDRNKEFKIILLLILFRAQKAFGLDVYGFILVNLGQVTTIVKTAASYFTLLKTIV